MRILAIVPSLYNTSPGQRYRIEQWEPILKTSGVEIEYAPFETEELRSVLYKPGNFRAKLSAVAEGVGRRARHIKEVGKYDAIYVFREAALLGPAWFESKLARTGVPLVFDFDDAVFVPYRSPSNGYLSYLKFPSKTATICRKSSHVMAGNEFLADYALRFNNNVTIVPTTIDTEKYTIKEKPDAGVLTIGWSGSHSTAQHLDTVCETLRELAKRERFKLRVIGVPKYKIEGIEVEAMSWRAETEVEDLRMIDIGIMPLPNDEWSKGKCGLKALQYMALSIPTVCSPVGVNTRIINDGVNGFIADGPDEWIDKLTRLLRSSQLRREIGSKGRDTVVQEYSAIAQAPRVLKVFESVLRK
jgi:glycosyltransferase involved in cell wall biosynthesis